MRFSYLLRTLLFIVIAFVLLQDSPAGGQATPSGKPVTIRGRITAVEGQQLTVATASGQVWVKVADTVRVGGVAAAKLSDIAPGTYIGTAARRQPDGTLRALEVHIFPEDRRGTGEGHRPYDLPNTTMTNANVEKVEEKAVEQVKGPMLTLKYKGGEAKIYVPPDTPIVKLVPGDHSMLKPGAGVLIVGTRAADGSISAVRISAGVGGIMPPM